MRRRNNYSDTKVDSKFEADLLAGPLKPTKNLAYHPRKIEYVRTSTHKYEPDWIYCKGSRVIFIESKGRFRTIEEANKYKYIKDYCDDCELVFVFYNPNTPMPNAKRRKDGTKLTHAEWAEKNGFKWYTKDNIKEAL